ncbi:hypothetical protein MBANPS3_003696 [Mucor bainieri]
MEFRQATTRRPSRRDCRRLTPGVGATAATAAAAAAFWAFGKSGRIAFADLATAALPVAAVVTPLPLPMATILTKHEREENDDIDKVNFKQKWVDFLADAEKSKNFHRYSPEKNGVTRIGRKLSAPPQADKKIYRNLKKNIGHYKPEGDGLEEYIADVMQTKSIEKFEELVDRKEIDESNKAGKRHLEADGQSLQEAPVIRRGIR